MLSFSLPLVAFVMGCAVQLQQRALLDIWVYGVFGVLAGMITIYVAMQMIVIKNASPSRFAAKHRATVLLMLCLLSAGWGWAQSGWRAASYASQALESRLEGVDLRVIGVIAAMPQRDESGIRFRLDVESAQIVSGGASQSHSESVTLPPRIALSWYRSLPRLSEDASAVPFAELQSGSAELKAGERWQMVVRLKAPHGNMNPHGFDYELWLWEQGIAATGYVRATPREVARGEGPLKIGQTRQHPIEAARQNVRDAIFARLGNPQLAGVIAALAVGDQAAIDRAEWDIYRATGVAHLMSISGLHITMFAWGSALLMGRLWRRSMRLTAWLPAQQAALIAGVLLAASYALFAGWGIPAQRTVWMLCLAAILQLMGKRWPWPLVWLLVLTLIVAIDPWALLSAGFWLSFVAVGILFASDAGRERTRPMNASQGLWRRLLVMLREQWVITLALAPLSLLLFNQVSIVGLAANVLAIPWVTLVITPLALLGAIVPPAWDAAAWGVGLLSALLAELAQWPFATLSVASNSVLISASAVFGSILLVLRMPWPLRLAGAVMVMPMLLLSPPRPALGEFTFLGADVGQGNAVLIQTAHHSLLYDAGPRFSRESDAGQRTLVPLLRALGEKLDVLMISHRDADHIGGAAAVLKMQPQAQLISSIENDNELQQLRKAERCTAGLAWHWDGIDFEILHPQAADYDIQQKPNAISCVLRISNGKQTALLVGDLEAAQEQRLVQQEAALQADLLLVPHHGSKTSSTPAFLDAVKPRFALVQAGYRNRFSHPVPEVMARYQERGIRIIQSAGCGALTWSSAQPQEYVCQRDVQRRYWHHRLP
jgi:competence protein ComEC